MTQTSIELLKVWFIFSFSLGCWTCINLLVSRRGDKRVKYTILSLILLLLVPPLNAYVNLISPEPIHWLLILSQKLTWVYGPVMVVLIRHILLRPISRLSYTLQALPLLISVTHDSLNLQWISSPILISLLFIQVFCYLAYAAWLLKSERAQLLKLTTQFKNTSYYWLIYLIASLFLVMLIDVSVLTSMLMSYIPSFVALAAIASFIAIFINSIALFSIYQPNVFFHEVGEPNENPMTEKQHLRSIELSPEAAKQLDEQLAELVKNHKPHLDEDISLPKLASLLGVTSHQLSELLNIHKSTSFYDFLNDLRYQESLHFLTANEGELTISDIAYRSGFNNRNSFYKVFKEKTGLTPSQYKKSVG
ncbi:MAG: AraC family transcriptional regulator [Gammaproteobacteria bacterium]|nr:MAG: AraC family transcriptional regulator [Gammaproteobacteria bacterium]